MVIVFVILILFSYSTQVILQKDYKEAREKISELQRQVQAGPIPMAGQNHGFGGNFQIVQHGGSPDVLGGGGSRMGGGGGVGGSRPGGKTAGQRKADNASKMANMNKMYQPLSNANSAKRL